jgi:dTDP-4-dehydrorhamnose 3,5-epimerase
MQFTQTILPWVYKIILPHSTDGRGSFTKVFHAEQFKSVIWYVPSFKESFYTSSHKDVIRGMHFQLPPSDLDKLVYVSSGSIRDVVLDLHANTETYGKYIAEELSVENHFALFIPKWFAHWFVSLSDNAVVHYITSEVYDPTCDTGICWDSFGYDWWIESLIISEKDIWLIPLSDFNSPF